MLRRLKSRKEGAESSARTPKAGSEKVTKTLEDMNAENETLNQFFEGLKKRGASESPRVTPGKRDKSRDSSSTPSKKAAARD